MAKELEKVAKELNVLFLNANDVTESSKVDGIHLDENQHQVLGVAVAQAVLEMLGC